ncbi:hypothetical protein [Deinococcus cellulosilyticus]|uniref:Uncharacterized protein n=1 Tax=Deinococcus cellulosilyticus (strain DSM 18568 / NBRC 106333 / KACC 11606 / 5516J-15) TaxID=1223518 RepID=A0A511MY26_DEIC1|nr:hypothetical protein [Deinococcus cellulosilyticus]GEM45490.1 hypothetical protein DC3_11250 [Deinococcus cellulosilyticus NBRC 106333 = KACC 11606]
MERNMNEKETTAAPVMEVQPPRSCPGNTPLVCCENSTALCTLPEAQDE